MKRLLLVITVIAVYVLHQDFWNWRTVTPLYFGFLPIGLFYHICYTLAVAAVMWLFVNYAWPSQLEKDVEAQPANPQSAIRNPQSPNSPLEDHQ